MAGVLLNDGISGGPNPYLKVVEIGSVHARRTDSDLLPFMSFLRPFYTALPTEASQVKSAATQVALEDTDSVTMTTIKVRGPSYTIQFRKGNAHEPQVDVPALLRNDAVQKMWVEEEFVKAYSSWSSTAWDELDWSKVKDLQVRELLVERQKMQLIVQHAECLKCPSFVKHVCVNADFPIFVANCQQFAQQHDEWLIKDHISQLQNLMSDQNLQLLPDYEQRIRVLQDLDFISGDRQVQLKGKVACEIHSADELVLTELVLENVLADYTPQEVVGLLSAFVFQEKTDNVPVLTPKLERGKEEIIRISEKVNHCQILHQVILSSEDSNDFVSRPRFGLVEVVYEWANGMSFNRITDLTDVQEGTIVRVVTRLDETIREVASTARLVGDPGLYQKMQEAREMIRRDVVFTASLYM